MTKQQTTLSVTPISTPRTKTTLRKVRSTKTSTMGNTASSTWTATRAPSGDFRLAARRPRAEPMPVNNIQLPSTMPKTSSLPEKAQSNSRISVNWANIAERPRQPTASQSTRVTAATP